jgi:putative nucleotidyltransferase with HDIG domain
MMLQSPKPMMSVLCISCQFWTIIICTVTLGFTTTAGFAERFAQAERDLKNRPQAVLEMALDLGGSPFDSGMRPSSLEQGLALGLACRACLELGQWVEALRYASQAVARLQDHPKHLADAQVALGLSQLPLGEYSAALETFGTAHQTYLTLGDVSGVVETAARLTRLQTNLKRFSEALQLVSHTLEYFAFRAEVRPYANLLFEAAHAHAKLFEQQHEPQHAQSAKAYLEQCQEIAKQDPELLEAMQHNIAFLYGMIGEENFAEAQVLALYNQFQPHQNAPRRMSSLLNLGHFAMQRGDYRLALERTLAALELAQMQHNREALLHCFNNLWQIEKQLGNHMAALEAHKKFHDLTILLRDQNAERRAQMFSVQLELESAKNESELHRVRSIELEQRVGERTRELEHAQLEMLERLAMAAEFRDYDTGLHTQRVGECAAKIAQALGLPSGDVEQLRLAARLHDIGKISIPDSILLGRSELTAEQWTVIRAHTEVGAKMLSGSQSPLVQLAEEIALSHHERWDGSGYPKGLAGEAIPLSGRITAVADVFDALLSERPYKHAWSKHAAIAEIRVLAGSCFDPVVVEAFLRCFADS